MLQNSNAAAAAAAHSAAQAASVAAASAAAAANNAALAASSIQPKLIVIRRRPNQGFGFTLRHFIAYPPEDDQASGSASSAAAAAASISGNWPQEASSMAGSSSGSSSSVVVVGGGITGLEPTSPTSLPPYQVKAMETIFIKEVQANGPAHYANLQTGDRVLMVNNQPIAGIAYSTIVSMIKQTPTVLTLHVVPKECDVLQMHYTSIAHTPESNRLTMSTHSPSLLANGSHKTTFPAATAAAAAAVAAPPQQQQLISYPAVAAVTTSSPAGSPHSHPNSHHAPSLHGGSRSGSITSTASGGITILSHQFYPQQQQQQQQHRHPALTGGSSSIDFGDMAHGLRQHQQQQQQQQQQQHLYQQQQHHHQFMRANQPPNLTVLSASSATNTPTPTPTARQPKSSTALSQALYAVSAGPGPSSSSAAGSGTGSGPHSGGSENSDLMIRLRESIKQKEEFLKSPVPASLSSSASASSTNGNQAQSSSPAAQQQQHLQQHQQHFFPSHTPPGGGGVQVVVPPPRTRHQVLLKQQQQQQQLDHVLGFDLYYSGGKLVQRSSTAPGSVSHHHQVQQQQQQQQLQHHHQQHQQIQQQQQHRQVMINNNAKYAKELDYFETLQETGVTNKVFERKLVSHMSKGFDPFKPLSINTSALESSASTSSSSTTTTVKKQSVLYESLQQHPLAKYHQTQQQHQQHQQHQMTTSTTTTVDGQTSSRMELHKATLANATIDPVPVGPSKFVALQDKPPAGSSVATLADIAESSAAAIVDCAVGSGNVVRRYKPLSSSSFDEGKPMRRISYLRATNNEADFNAEAAPAGGDAAAAVAAAGSVSVPAAPPPAGTAPSSAAPAIAPASVSVSAPAPQPISIPIPVAAVVEPQKTKSLVEEHPDPTYDVIGGTGGGHEFIETPNGLEDVRLSAHGSRRASMSSDMRSSIHIDAELNGKYVPNELEAFETEIEIKSSCINGKRMSEYRSWRQVKLEIKGDLLRIYSGRHAKSEHNVIELDIRNFKFFDESLDKKKYLIRMQSKPSPSGAHLASLGNELNLDEGHPDKLLTSSGSSSANEPAANSTSALTASTSSSTSSSGPYTEILFKTKSSNEMKRLFGLLQWKDSLNYDDNQEHQQQGKQLAEPQKTVASASYLDDVQGGAADSSPLSSHSGGIAEASGGHHHVSALPAAAAIVAATSDSISPVMKARKSSSHKHIPDKDLGSPKSKNWKDLLFRRGGSGSGGVSHHDLASPSACAAKQIGSIGVPLRSCPMSKVNGHVPHLVEVCTNIVETKGLGVVGIYRIPGNKAAISELSELVNTKDFQFESCATDDRWEDVNVVSSLLKLFIRSLPDALMPANYYINFIEADKKFGLERIVLLREIVESLPRHPYETMKHLIRHLCRVSGNCEVNRMEPKNLAIIFGPSIIRTPNDTLETAVKDMKHQCRIVELLVTQYEYFFEGGSLPDLAEVSGGNAAVNAAQPQQQTQEDQTSMLLHNLSKIERITERETTRTSRFMPQLRRKTHGKRSAVNSDTYSGESVLSLDYTKVSTSASASASASSTASTSSSSTLHSGKASSSSSSTTKFSSSSSSASSTTAVAVSSSISATSSKLLSANFKKRSTGGFLGSRSSHQTRKASLDEKDSGQSSGSLAHSLGVGLNLAKEQQRSSVDISILLTDDDSSSRLSDTGSMSLTTITDTLDSKLRNLRSGSESNDENGSPEFPKNRRHTLGQPLHLHSENIPYADESPERLFHQFCNPLDAAPLSLHLSRSCTATNTIGAGDEKPTKQSSGMAPLPPSLLKAAHKLQHSATVPIHQGSSTAPTSGAATPVGTPTGSSSGAGAIPSRSSSSSVTTLTKSIHPRFSNYLSYERSSAASAAGAAERSAVASAAGGAASEDDSEGSTTSDPKEKLLLGERPSPSFFLERYNKKRRDHRLFRSASFNCRNYSTRHMTAQASSSGGGGSAGGVAGGVAGPAVAVGVACCQALSATGLTKDEKTDMNLTKKRQIQNKQNRSIKRRHTVGGPHDYSASNGSCSNHSHGHDLAAINYNHHNRHHQQQLLKLGSATSAGGGGGAAAAETTTTTTTTTTVLRRLGAAAAAQAGAEASVALPGSGSGSSNSSNNNNSPQSDGSNGNGAGVAGVPLSAQPSGSGVVTNSSSGGSSNSSSTSTTPAGDQVLEVGIRIKNINRGRF
ncbi:uncharacterized protein LOC119558185 isoform X3 [Drosophila subpulchrella]|uniref:uncharacterized protein LOC119558185 isoform X3 n=1 Tax=Drosophila subpulchrella TaxID=1486046 RepID=UPI0018A173EE|nr:uncharacterized protein LOC119558185 isoform X3 [Drosophila subpulchrella]